jgi:hypothetical protein
MFSIPLDTFIKTAIHFGLDYSNITVLKNYDTAFFKKKKNVKVHKPNFWVKFKVF